MMRAVSGELVAEARRRQRVFRELDRHLRLIREPAGGRDSLRSSFALGPVDGRAWRRALDPPEGS